MQEHSADDADRLEECREAVIAAARVVVLALTLGDAGGLVLAHGILRREVALLELAER